MSKSSHRLLLAAFAAFAAMTAAGVAYAVDAPPQVPAGISAGAPVFAERSAVMAAFTALNTHIDTHNARCSAVRSDDAALIAECTQSNAQLDAEETQYRSRLQTYLDNLRTAKRQAGSALLQGGR